MEKNAQLKAYLGAMGCGKTRKLLGEYHGKIEDGFNVIVLKPKVDKKGDDTVISRDGGNVIVNFLIDSDDNIYMKICEYVYSNNLDYILIDEAQFLSSRQIDELAMIVDTLKIDVICYGLRTDFRGILFEGSKRLLEIADPVEFLSRTCTCGNNKIFNIRLVDGEAVFEGEQVAIDGIDAKYESVCRKCYQKIRKKSKN